MDFNPQAIANDGTAIFATDKDLLVKFKIHSELSQHKSVKQGAPVYDDVEIVEVRTPGEPEPVIVPATEFHRRRFPKQYEAFKAGLDNQHGGTPLELLFPSQPSTVKQLQHFHIYSIQQLANISDTAKANIPMGQSLVDRARDYLKKAGDGQGFHLMEAMQNEIAQLKAALEERGVTPEVNQPERRGPGRPRKDKDAA